MKIPDVETTPILRTIEMTPLARDTGEPSASTGAGLAERLRGQTLKLAVFVLPSIVFDLHPVHRVRRLYVGDAIPGARFLRRQFGHDVSRPWLFQGQ